MNRPKQIGTAAETAIVRYARLNGFGGADRQPLRGNLDQGDVTLCPGVIVESKSHKTAGTGQPGPKVLATWLDETELERVNARSDHALLIVKRSGTTNVAAWWCYLPMWQLTALLGTDSPPQPDAIVCLPVAAVFVLLRSAGFGDALQPIEAPGHVAPIDTDVRVAADAQGVA